LNNCLPAEHDFTAIISSHQKHSAVMQMKQDCSLKQYKPMTVQELLETSLTINPYDD